MFIFGYLFGSLLCWFLGFEWILILCYFCKRLFLYLELYIWVFWLFVLWVLWVLCLVLCGLLEMLLVLVVWVIFRLFIFKLFCVRFFGNCSFVLGGSKLKKVWCVEVVGSSRCRFVLFFGDGSLFVGFELF